MIGEERTKQVYIEPEYTEDLHKTDPNMPSVRCLGVLYHPDTDSLQFLGLEQVDPAGWSKRQLVSHVAKAYDPQGLINPLILRGRLLAQALWRYANLDWDDEAPEEILKAFKRWVDAFQDVHTLCFPRRIKLSDTGTEFLAIFCDSTDEAQGAVCYMVSGDQCP